MTLLHFDGNSGTRVLRIFIYHEVAASQQVLLARGKCLQQSGPSFLRNVLSWVSYFRLNARRESFRLRMRGDAVRRGHGCSELGRNWVW